MTLSDHDWRKLRARAEASLGDVAYLDFIFLSLLELNNPTAGARAKSTRRILPAH
jgi:hypothetical protein